MVGAARAADQVYLKGGSSSFVPDHKVLVERVDPTTLAAPIVRSARHGERRGVWGARRVSSRTEGFLYVTQETYANKLIDGDCAIWRGRRLLPRPQGPTTA